MLLPRALALLALLLLGGGGDGQANSEPSLTRTSYFRSAQGNVLPSVFESDPPTSILDVLRGDLNLRDEKSPERKAMSKKLATGQLVRIENAFEPWFADWVWHLLNGGEPDVGDSLSGAHPSAAGTGGGAAEPSLADESTWPLNVDYISDGFYVILNTGSYNRPYGFRQLQHTISPAAAQFYPIKGVT